jgi:hypothetical protein
VEVVIKKVATIAAAAVVVTTGIINQIIDTSL